MKFAFRDGVFETNSSSVHSICICSESDYQDFVHENGVYYDIELETLARVGKDIFIKENGKIVAHDSDDYENMYTYDNDGGRFKTFEQLQDYWEMYEQYDEHYTTSGGENIVAFGMYGDDR